jgi:hypothetical protein
LVLEYSEVSTSSLIYIEFLVQTIHSIPSLLFAIARTEDVVLTLVEFIDLDINPDFEKTFKSRSFLRNYEFGQGNCVYAEKQKVLGLGSGRRYPL